MILIEGYDRPSHVKVHLYGFRWVSESGCQIQASVGEKFARKPLAIGDKLSLEISGEVHCAGSVFEGVWQRCPENATGKAQCSLCRAREKNFVYTMFDGFNRENFTDADLLQISGAHVVYVAYFAPELYKIGVSHLERKMLRQLEQGSHATLFIAQTPDGIAARQIETLIRRHGIVDKVKPSQKQDFICPEVTDATVEEELRSLWRYHSKALEEYAHLLQMTFDTPEFCAWGSVYGLPNILSSSKPFHAVSLGTEEWVSGVVRAIKGPFVILETDEELVSICMKDLLGYDIDFEDKIAGLNLKSALQKSLF